MRRPAFLAEQARNARGPLGRFIAFVMARETWSDNLAAIEALAVQPTDHVLDIGCGHGRALGELARRAPRGRVAGADPSELMVEHAVQRNRDLVRAKLVDVAHASVETLRYDAAVFDKALCVHSVYFWRDLERAFAEIARVLKPGGRAAFVLRTAANKAAAAFPSEVYRFWSRLEVEQAMIRVGLSATMPNGVDERIRPILIVASKRK
ncbi:MAG: class I SAM-dependent methyltransferase [Rhodospirillaceae bacterium]|nr:class I SAM-dependent methyltransferase [Rhodospirillaceae bacterium]